MKLNLRKGWFRLAILTSFLWPIYYISEGSQTQWLGLAWIISGLCIIWIIYWAIKWLVEDFVSTDDET